MTADQTPHSEKQAMGQYYLLEKLAQGGMAEIYKGLAYDLHGIKRTVVIKKILPHAAANREFIDMLIAEAKIAVMLSQGNIAQIYDLGKAGDDYFIVMEYVEGWSVSQVQRECAARHALMPIPIACFIAAEIASGLDYMHERTDESGRPLHIVHRDVSPQNVMVSTSGTIKIIDFGIAKARTKLETTEVGILKGKFAYMSPEHASGDPIDHRSDIFSLGVILHEMLTGRRLFKAKEQRETLRNVRRAHVLPPSALREDVPVELDRMVLKALARGRDRRYGRAATLRADLLRFLYQHDPNFRSAQVVDYVSGLLADTESAPEGEKTPFLIIDHTQSAIAQENAFDAPEVISSVMGDFMVPFGSDESPPTDCVVDGADVDEVSVTSVRAEWWLALQARWSRFWRRRWHAIARVQRHRGLRVSVLLMALLVALGLLGWERGWWQAWLGPDHPILSRMLPVETTPIVEASISMASSPSGAQIFLNDQDTGRVTPSVIPHLDPEHTYRIGLYMSGYKYWSTEVKPPPDAPWKIEVPLTIDYGTLKILSTPSGALVRLNGRRVGRTPYVQEQVRPGEVFRVEVQQNGYASQQETVRIRPGETIDLRLTLVRMRGQ